MAGQNKGAQGRDNPGTDRSSRTSPGGQANPKYTIVLIGDDGHFYKLTKEEWMQEKYRARVENDAEAQGIVNQLKEFGSYLAYIPNDIAVGLGWYCTVINLQSILKNQEPDDSSTTGATGSSPEGDE